MTKCLILLSGRREFRVLSFDYYIFSFRSIGTFCDSRMIRLGVIMIYGAGSYYHEVISRTKGKRGMLLLVMNVHMVILIAFTYKLRAT